MKGTLLRFVVYTLAIAAVVVSGGAIAVYTISRNEVHTAQQMMNDVARLQIGKSGLSDALAFVHKYNGEATGSWRANPCLESDCLVTAAPDSHDFWVRHPKLSYAEQRVSRRSWQFVVWMWGKDGKLTAIEQWFGYYAPHTSSFVVTMLNEPGRRFVCQNRSYRLHHTFAVKSRPASLQCLGQSDSRPGNAPPERRLCTADFWLQRRSRYGSDGVERIRSGSATHPG